MNDRRMLFAPNVGNDFIKIRDNFFTWHVMYVLRIILSLVLKGEVKYRTDWPGNHKGTVTDI